MVKPYCTVGTLKRKAIINAQIIAIKGESKRWDTRSVEKNYVLEVYS